MLEKEEEKDGGKFRERGERREGTGGVFRLNTLTFISALQHTYARFWGKVRTLVCAHTNAPPPHPQKKDTMDLLYFLHQGIHTQKSTAIPVRF